jgi:AcrR family transcriptional regulator
MAAKGSSAYSVAVPFPFSIRDVERRAGVNRGLVAHHFGDKEALWQATVDWLMREFAAELDRYREFLDLVSQAERPRIMLKVYVRFISKHPEFFRLVLLEGSTPSPRSQMLAERYMAPLEQFFQRASGIDHDPTPADTAVRHFILFGAASAAFALPAHFRYLFGFDPSADDFVERYAEGIADMWMATFGSAQAIGAAATPPSA